MLIDIHTHASFARHQSVTRPSGKAFPTPERLIEMMDDHAIDKAIVLSTVSPECRYTLVTPEETLEICRQYPDRLIPFCSMDPRFLTNSPAADFRPLLRAYQEMGCKGIGEYMPNLAADDPLNMNLFAQAAEVGLPLTFHIAPRYGNAYGMYDDVGLTKLETVLRTFPDLVLLGHSQPFWAEISTNVVENGARTPYPKGPVQPGRLVELFRKYPNLHGDLSAGSGLGAISRDPAFGHQFMEEFADRLHFGTDIANDPQELPIVEYFQELKREGRISEEAFEKITHRNTEALLGV
jgi:hypothetical protein